MRSATAIALSVYFSLGPQLGAWGVRGHTGANLAAVAGIPPDGPEFLRAQKAYIGHLGTIPDTWRSPSEPWLRISEDANHGWYTEAFDFIPDPLPISRKPPKIPDIIRPQDRRRQNKRNGRWRPPAHG